MQFTTYPTLTIDWTEHQLVVKSTNYQALMFFNLILSVIKHEVKLVNTEQTLQKSKDKH